MSRDGRGNPGRIVLKNQPRLRLADVLRRRKSNLKALVTELGVATYSGLVNWCDRMGIVPPDQSEFDVHFPPLKVNSPQEGVVVLEAPPVLDEQSGQAIDPEAPVEPGVEVVIGPSDQPQKKRRAKKESQPDEG